MEEPERIVFRKATADNWATVRITKELLDRLKKWADFENTNKSQVINRAVDHYITSKECIFCRTRNPPNGVLCSACARRLHSDEEMFGVLTEIKNEYIKKMELPLGKAVREGEYQHRYDIHMTIDDGEREYYIVHALVDPQGTVIYPSKERFLIPIVEIRKRLEETQFTVKQDDGEKITIKIDNTRNWEIDDHSHTNE